MSNKDNTISGLIRQIAGTDINIPVKICDCTVVSLDEENRICFVNSTSGNKTLNNFPVRYMLQVDDGELDVPQIDSVVSVIFSEFTEPYIVKSTELSKKEITIGNQSYEIVGDKQTFNDGSYGGIPILKDPDNTEAGLLKKINNLEKQFNDLKTAFMSWVVVPSDGGLALWTILNTPPLGWATNQITPTAISEIQNPNITHGKDNPET